MDCRRPGLLEQVYPLVVKAGAFPNRGIADFRIICRQEYFHRLPPASEDSANTGLNTALQLPSRKKTGAQGEFPVLTYRAARIVQHSIARARATGREQTTTGASRCQHRIGVKMSCCSDVMEPVESSSCCTPEDTTADAARAMRTSGFGCAPVLECFATLTVVGVVRERDGCGPLADDGQASGVSVAEVMRPSSSAGGGVKEFVDRARRRMREHRVTSLPVVDEAGSFCGIVCDPRLESR
ncbi:MAG: CBS domain-containing protein [Acidobacteriota bacterium]